jgi:dGTPase
MFKKEEELSPFASSSKNAIRLKGNLNEDIRLAYQRDIDKIIHTNVYTRYIDKTQVYTDVKNDNISRRMTHVQFVSRASRTIARALSLNEDLCEAIALGHDVGHTPFGHTGEHILNDISKEKLNQVFAHNLNSVRVFTTLENNGKGSNLTLQVLDGIMCHNGEIIKNKYAPVKKDIEVFKSEYENCLKNEENIKKLVPMTLEGCVVRISDVIGYIGKDIEDAKRLKIITDNIIPKDIKDVLGTTNSDIMDNLIIDIIENSYNKGYITMSDRVFNALNLLMEFNLKEIYLKANSKDNLKTYNDIFYKLFDIYLSALNNTKKSNNIFNVYLKNMDKEYIQNNSKEQIIIDYMSGMTDRFIENEYERYVK